MKHKRLVSKVKFDQGAPDPATAGAQISLGQYIESLDRDNPLRQALFELSLMIKVGVNQAFFFVHPDGVVESHMDEGTALLFNQLLAARLPG